MPKRQPSPKPSKTEDVKLRVEAKSGSDVVFTTNWEERHKDGVVHIDIGKEHATIYGEDLKQFAFLLCDEKEEEMLIPTIKKLHSVFEKKIRIVATKDIAKGDDIIANVRFEIPRNILATLVAGLDEDNDNYWKATTEQV